MVSVLLAPESFHERIADTLSHAISADQLHAAFAQAADVFWTAFRFYVGYAVAVITGCGV